MAIESIVKFKPTETNRLSEKPQDDGLKLSQDELEKKVLEILRQPPKKVDTRKIVYQATRSVLPNAFEEFDCDEFKRRINVLDQKRVKPLNNN